MRKIGEGEEARWESLIFPTGRKSLHSDLHAHDVGSSTYSILRDESECRWTEERNQRER